MNIDRSELFIYIIIIIVFIAIFRLLNIGLNIILALIVAFLLISYLYNSKKTEKFIENDNNIIKKKLIRPPNKLTSSLKYPDINNFLFSIQESYSFSPMNYEDMVDAIEDFFTLYENSENNPKNATIYYELAEQKKSDALNALHSIIYNSEVAEGGKIIEKNDRARDQLNYMLGIYLHTIREIGRKYTGENGYKITTRVNQPDSWPKASNYFIDLDVDFNDGKFGKFVYELY